jgi:3-isopropylmalate dehydrogenase
VAKHAFSVAVFEGDGIGPEVMAPTLRLLTKALHHQDEAELLFESLPAGAAHYRETGESLPARSLAAARAADAILLSAMGLPDVRYPNGTEISPQIELRIELGLYAGVRPVHVFPGQPTPLADPRAASMDFVLIRESTEGLFHSQGKGVVTDDHEARELLLITRDTSERLFDFAFRLASRRREQGRGKGLVTCVDKANVFTAFAFFRRIFRERARQFPDIDAEAVYVDAMALRMVREPWTLDVLVTENMFGDILSDLGAGLMGGLGFAPSADIGDAHAVFQPCHGSAPDIAGRGWANPAAMILSGAMMLDWLGQTHQHEALVEAGGRLRDAVAAVIASGEARTRDWGGTALTEQFASAVESRLG